MSLQARKAALIILSDVADNGSFLNLSLKKYLPEIKEAENRRFAAALASTAVQNMIRIDYILGRFVQSKRVHKIIRNILRLGVCQLMFFESVPVSAAVNESVKLAAAFGKTDLKGFVNGVLRNISKNLGSVEYPDRDGQSADFLSVFYSYPKWLCEKYLTAYGFDFTQNMLSYNADTALTCVRISKDALQSIGTGDSFLPGRYFEDARYLRNAPSIERMPLFISGAITPQGESSMLCVRAAGISPEDDILDVCAAPGGKAAYASVLCKRLTAMDIHPHRVELIRKTFGRLHVQNAQTLAGDGTVFNPEFNEKFDVVMIDAPCSALGLLYRKPDIKIHKKAEDIPQLIALQRALMQNCAKYVKPDGKLLYTTCTVNPDENGENVTWFLKNNADFILDDFSSDIPQELAGRIRDGTLQLFWHIDGIDGFFIARMRKLK
jgi:16S rRNA (cytosine967-C5)-methyltransferase